MRLVNLLWIWIGVTLIAGLGALVLGLPSHGTLVIVAAAASAVTLLGVWLRWRRVAKHLSSIDQFAAQIDSPGAKLDTDVPTVLRQLAATLVNSSSRVQRALELSNLELARRQVVLTGMAEGVLAVNEDLRVTFCNEAFAEDFNIRQPVQQGRLLFEVVREPILREILQATVADRVAVRKRVRLPSANGRWFEIHALPLMQTKPSGAIAVLHDITETERQEQSRKDFVANVSHELRTPLASIRGYAETLLDGAIDDEVNKRRFVEIIQSHSTRLNNIASDLLILSELDSHALVLAPAEIDLRDIIETALRTVETNASMRDVTFRVDSCDIRILGNRLRMEQVLVNLLDNAVKFNREGGTVTVECRERGSRALVSVKDTGVGIPSEDLKRVFERFYRVDKARSRAVGGTGLGLSIVKELVEQMGGQVQVESRLGQGTQFTIDMPSRPQKTA